ncbi:MAG: acylphosphatase [Polyangiaceae bacterium]|nr:acylphosphatase [Polyangiaceae bacterium]
MTTKRVAITVFGHVQGVGYRYFVLEAAEALGVGGWVKNRFDGAVEVEAQADPQTLDELRARLRQGPPHAYVAALEEHELPVVSGESLFRIRG